MHASCHDIGTGVAIAGAQLPFIGIRRLKRQRAAGSKLWAGREPAAWAAEYSSQSSQRDTLFFHAVFIVTGSGMFPGVNVTYV